VRVEHFTSETPHSNFVGQASLYSESLCPSHAPEYRKRVLQETRTVLQSLNALCEKLGAGRTLFVDLRFNRKSVKNAF